MIIDMHSHWIPLNLIEEFRKREMPPRVRTDKVGRVYIDQPRGSFPLPSDYGNVEERLKSMYRNGIHTAVLSISGVFGIEALPLNEALDIARKYSNAISTLHLEYPDRLFGLASLPIADLKIAAEEFDRALGVPGIVGAILPGNGFLTLESAQRFRPIFDIAQKHNAHILVHTGVLPNDKSLPPSDDIDNARERRVTLDMQSRISSNMITLCMTDFLQEYPDVTVQCHNLGGNIPFEIDRLDHISLDREPENDPPSIKIRHSNVLVDCNSMGARNIERAVEVYGAPRIVFGTDGTEFGAAWSTNAINEAKISDTAKDLILNGNAQKIIDRHR
ncbi:MAG TPA: hypothetical protein DCY55_13670 [Gammaproteobacteria bacterium]|nr:hypothetical protein [Gammaproteobacteria bacterium]